MKDLHITSNKDHMQSMMSVLEGLITYIRANSKPDDTSKDTIKLIDRFNKEKKLLDYDKTVFNPDYDEIISLEILKTYDAISCENRFSTVLQVCDCNNLNLLEHLWSAILLVDHIIDKINSDADVNYFSFTDFRYMIFLNLEGDHSNETLDLLNDLIRIIKFDRSIEFLPLITDDQFDTILYNERLAKRLNKIDLLLLLDNSDITNLKHLKVVETLGLIQPYSFIISTSQNLVYSRYVAYSPCEKNRLIKKSKSDEKHPGRWNLVYNTKCIKTGYYQGVNIEMTRCVEYLDG